MDTSHISAPLAKIINYSPPASPATTTTSSTSSVAVGTSEISNNQQHEQHYNLVQHSSPTSETNFVAAPALSGTMSPTMSPSTMSPSVFTPKKDLLSAVMLQTIREKLLTPGGACEVQALAFEDTDAAEQTMRLVKDRYLINAKPSHISAAAAAKTPASYRHLIDLTSSNLKCIDIYTGEEYLCKIINEPLYKVQRAYFQLQQEEDMCRSTIYGHDLIRGVHDIVPLSRNRTYIIVAPTSTQGTHDSSGIALGIYENLHTYIRNQKRIDETEARAIFHQICQTVQVCHKNGIILRDLKLKRFYFIDEARTKLQYESLEGSMILDDPEDDTLSDKIGCPLYTAPELLCPNPTYQGKPADMWSLGVILYTMLVGQYPFYEKANCNLITIIRHGNVHIPNSLSKSVRWMLLGLLRKNYAERLTASHIFLVPWLKEQRPFHMYLPINVEVMEDDDYDANSAFKKENKCTNYATLQQEITLEEEHHILPNGVANEDNNEVDIGVQPLDYTQTTLQLVAEQMAAAAALSAASMIHSSINVDVDMG